MTGLFKHNLLVMYSLFSVYVICNTVTYIYQNAPLELFLHNSMLKYSIFQMVPKP